MVNGEHGLRSERKADRRRFRQTMAGRIAVELERQARPGEEDPWAPIRRGWILGSGAFRERIEEMITATVKRRKRESYAADAIRAAGEAAHHWAVGRYVVLPDHIHLFRAPARQVAAELKKWVRFWKTLASRGWPRLDEQPVWQIDCWGRQLRSGESYGRKWNYVRDNPVRHGIVGRAEDWPCQEELHSLAWHD